MEWSRSRGWGLGLACGCAGNRGGLDLVVGVAASPNDRGVAHAPRLLERDAAGGGRGGEVAGHVERDGAH